MTEFEQVLKLINGLLWGLPLIVLLLGTGLFLTVRLGFIQIRGFKEAFRLLFFSKDDKEKGDISHFQALMTALAATVGTGNIVGVATAVTLGGPGAIFWMWMTGLLGMATKYSEAVLAVKYRVVDEEGRMAGGPMYYIEKGLKMKWLAIAFALFASFAAFGIGNLTQSNSLTDAVITLTGVPELSRWYVGLPLAVLTGVVILGGIKEIGVVAGYLIPVMIVAYVGAGLFILGSNIELIPNALGLIIKHAFVPVKGEGFFSGFGVVGAGAGGLAGFAIAQAVQAGVARGIFSNESGLGSAPIAAAAAKTKDPVSQALVSMTQTFIDTLVVCTITGLIIVISDAWRNPDLKGLALTNAAFNHGFAGGSYIVSVGLVLFTFTTILGWYYYGERSVHYLLGKVSIIPYKVLWVVVVFLGAAILKIDVVWTLSDIMNALMAFPNLVALILLNSVIRQETITYFNNKARK